MLNTRPWLVKHRKQRSGGNGMRCSGKNTKMHAVARYNRRWHIALLSHEPPDSDSELSIFTPRILNTIKCNNKTTTTANNIKKQKLQKKCKVLFLAPEGGIILLLNNLP